MVKAVLISLIVPVVIVALIVGGFYYWARRQGLHTTGQAAEGEGTRRISLLTEAVAYIGVILLLVGGAAALGQRWNDIPSWGHVGVSAGVAVFFLLAGFVGHRVREPAIQPGRGGVVPFRGRSRRGRGARGTRGVRERQCRGHGHSRGAGCHLVLGGPVADPPGRAAEPRPVRGLGRHHPRHYWHHRHCRGRGQVGSLAGLRPCVWCSGWRGRGSGGNGTSSPCG